MARILIADDSQTLRHQLSLDLQEFSHEVLQAQDGLEAIELLKIEPKVDLIILDVNMPKADGFEVLKKMRGAKLQESALVFMLTTDSSEKMKELAKTLSVTAWITKPYQKDSLMKVINQVLKNE